MYQLHIHRYIELCCNFIYNEFVNQRYNDTPESELIPILKSNFLFEVEQTDTNLDNFSIGEEFRSQYGIPDLLFYNFDKRVLDKRIENDIKPILSKDIIKTLLLIQNKKKITLSFLQANLPIDKDTIKKDVIRYLVTNNYLNRSLSGYDSYWVGDNIYESCMDEMFAVEAKVSSWKRGFYQAYRYKWFSNYSFLALHDSFINPAINNLILFKKYNIGLISVDTNKNNLKLIHKPKKEMPYSGEIAALTIEKLFSDYYVKNATSQSAQSSFLII